MVARLLILLLIFTVNPVWGGKPRSLCLSCHSVHYAAQGSCVVCHLGNPIAERKNIAHTGLRSGKYARFMLDGAGVNRTGEQLLVQLACRRCHTSAGNGNSLAVNLDDSAVRKLAEDLAFSIRNPVVAMPNFALREEQVELLVNTVLSGTQGRHTDSAAPVKVHFRTSGSKSADIFSTKCGSCHRLLSQQRGALGTGTVAPNLSGLFSEYYPKTFKNGEAWNVQHLDAWLKNPRETRRWAQMLPVSLTVTEMQELVSIVSIPAVAKKKKGRNSPRPINPSII
ncbi:MAG: selenite/tellurite reduction operon c-type cytochrome lipoprotein ExtS [Desulfuromonadaceae bacterium]|nr:selenite/tellurite reduction operon c-type cytochrome lipoprotein ExtS [Desulfuromonadaceae bacterium]MDD5105731.1 selenite/tellurite reduction operon c-type cytochrome lipoprotein ExtS [Desulfuromonadaceae bacterium]